MGYIHCYSVTHPTDSQGKEVTDDYLVKVRLRYFDKAEGDTIRALLDNAAEKTSGAYPFVRVEAQPEVMQYENVAYSMFPGLPAIIQKSAAAAGLPMKPKSERGGTTSAMMAAKGLRGGPAYSADNRQNTVSTNGLRRRHDENGCRHNEYSAEHSKSCQRIRQRAILLPERHQS